MVKKINARRSNRIDEWKRFRGIISLACYKIWQGGVCVYRLNTGRVPIKLSNRRRRELLWKGYTWKATIIVVTTAAEMKFSFNLRSNAELHTPSGGRIGTRNNLRFQVINQICVRRRQVNFNERTIRRFLLKSLNRKYAPRNKRTIP